MEINKILVPIDFSSFSDKALEFALEIAERFKSNLALLHAVVLFRDDINEEQQLQEYEEWLKMHESRLTSHMHINKKKAAKREIEVETHILRGISPADVILDFLNDHNFDLIVMGTHGRTGLKHLFQGSVAEKIVRLSPVPVLAVHRSVTKFQVQKILVPIDFSSYSKEATDYAIAIAQNLNAQIDFIHVIEQEIHPSFYASGIKSIFQIDKGLKDRVIYNMKDFLADQISPDIQVNFLVREGRAHKEIVDYSKENNSNIIVIATHGLTGLDYILLGSTTEKVIRWANCPVLTIKRKS